MAKVKFSSKIERDTLRDLLAYAKEAKLNIADVISDAVARHLECVHVRPIFRKAVDDTIAQNRELYRKLAE